MDYAMIALEIFSILILSVVIYGCLFEFRRKSKVNSAFTVCAVSVLAGLIFDLLAWILDGNERLSVLVWAVNFFSFISGYVMLLTATKYFLVYVSERRRTSVYFFRIMKICFAVSLIATLFFSLNGGYFYIENGCYVVGRQYYHSQIFSCFALLFNAFIILRHAKLLGWHDTAGMLSYIVLLLVSVLLHFLFPQLSLSFVASAFAVLLIYCFLQMKYESEMRISINELRTKLAIKQMQPHFLYNALSSIREIVLEDPDSAYDLLYDFSVHLRACIRTMSDDYPYISFHQELENVKAYAKIEEIKFSSAVNIVYDIQEENFDVIPLSVQPLVENALLHGLWEKKIRNGTVTVRSEKTDTDYVITVLDDGGGFDPDKIFDEASRGERNSTGLANLRFRLENLLFAKLTIDSRIGKGTTVQIRIPVRIMDRIRKS